MVQAIRRCAKPPSGLGSRQQCWFLLHPALPVASRSQRATPRVPRGVNPIITKTTVTITTTTTPGPSDRTVRDPGRPTCTVVNPIQLAVPAVTWTSPDRPATAADRGPLGCEARTPTSSKDTSCPKGFMGVRVLWDLATTMGRQPQKKPSKAQEHQHENQHTTPPIQIRHIPRLLLLLLLQP
jgi:hypothetical protein